jgi:Pyridoxamine 5'-phosphate oxidase
MFTEKEIAYINSQHLARLATVSKSGQTDVAPVGFRFDGKTFFITGFDITKTFKYKNVKAGNTLVSLVIDDLASVVGGARGQGSWNSRNRGRRRAGFAGHSSQTLVELGRGRRHFQRWQASQS